MAAAINSHASSRTERYFLESFFRERNYCPRTALSGKKCRSILSNQVISWNGSRADRCPLGREITAKPCSLLLMNPCFMKFLHWTCSLLLWFMNPLHSQLLGTNCRQVMLLPKFLSRKKLSRKYRSIFGLKIRSCDRRHRSVQALDHILCRVPSIGPIVLR